MDKHSKQQTAADLLQQGKAQEAIALLDEGIKQGESSELWNDWAVAHAIVGHTDMATRGLRRALELNPNNADAARNLETLEGRGGNVDEGAKALDPKDKGSVLHQRARERFREGRLQAAAAAICKALDCGETSIRWNDYGTIALALASLEEAERGYRRAVELDDKNAVAATNLVILLRRLKRTEEANQFLPLTTETLLTKQEKEVEEVYRRYEQAHLG